MLVAKYSDDKYSEYLYYRHMASEAVGVYIQTLRKLEGFTQESLAEALGISKRTIERIERAEGAVTTDNFDLVVNTVRALPDHIHYLKYTATATIEDAVRLAEEWSKGINLLSQSPNAYAAQIAESLPPEKVEEFARLVVDLKEKPSLIDQIIGYGSRLLEERAEYRPGSKGPRRRQGWRKRPPE